MDEQPSDHLSKTQLAEEFYNLAHGDAPEESDQTFEFDKSDANFIASF